MPFEPLPKLEGNLPNDYLKSGNVGRFNVNRENIICTYKVQEQALKFILGSQLRYLCSTKLSSDIALSLPQVIIRFSPEKLIEEPTGEIVRYTSNRPRRVY